MDQDSSQGQNKSSLPQPTSGTLPPQTVANFLEVQAKEIEVRSKEIDSRNKELEFQKTQDEHQFQFATSSLTATAEDRDRQRQHQYGLTKIRYGFLFAIILLILAFISYSLFIGKDQIALEAIKALSFFFAGGAGAYYAGKSAGYTQRESESGEK